jgi:hypothetical protein
MASEELTRPRRRQRLEATPSFGAASDRRAPARGQSVGIGRRGRSGSGSGESLAFRIRRVAICAAIIALIPASISYLLRMAEPSNTSLSIRSVEWLRSNGAAGIVNSIESVYYSLTAPEKGGPALHKLPRVGIGAAAAPLRSATEYRPPNIAPLTRPALPGEGVWVPARSDQGVNPPLLLTTFRSEPTEYPRIVAGVAWINTHKTNIVLYPGQLQPSVEMPNRGPEEVPPSLRYKLLATFNSAFKLEDSNGGFALNGHVYAPLRDGQATFVKYSNGTYNVEAWHGSESYAPDVVFARQNLPLIVEDAHRNPRLNNSAERGATLGNAVRVWRSGIGIDAHGDLIYAAANDQTAESLANILIHAGAVRAMELDINSYWISFNTYGAPGARDPQKLLAEIERPATRYLEPDERDFFAVYEQ